MWASLLDDTVFPFLYHVGDTKKELIPLGHLEVLPLALLKMVLSPFVSEKEDSDYMDHGIQIDRLELMVSTQKWVLKNMH